jgi:hypothetical protein
MRPFGRLRTVEFARSSGRDWGIAFVLMSNGG